MSEKHAPNTDVTAVFVGLNMVFSNEDKILTKQFLSVERIQSDGVNE